MAEPISEGKSVKKSSSFTKFLRSPARSATNTPKRSSSNPLSKLLLRRRSSRRGDEEDYEGGSNSARRSSVDSEPIDAEEEDTPSLTEDVKQVVDSAVDRVFHNRDNHDSSFKQPIDPVAIITEAKDELSSVVAEIKEGKVDKFKEELGKAEEDFKKEYTKAEDELHTLVEPSNIVQRVQQEVVNVATEIDSKEGTSSSCCQGEECIEKNVEKKEENCIATLALGLQKLCAPWSLKKED